MAKPKLLNVKYHLIRIESVLTDMIENAGKHGPNGLQLPPIYADELRSIRFVNRAILRKHADTGTRKDIRIEVVKSINGGTMK